MVLRFPRGRAQRGASPPASASAATSAAGPACGTLRPGPCVGRSGERGSQTVELALLLPVVALLVVLVLQGGMAASDLVLAQTAAREAARAAAVDDDVAARAAARRVAGSREISVRVDPSDGQRVIGEPVTVEVELHSDAFARIGVPLRLPARAVMRVEQP